MLTDTYSNSDLVLSLDYPIDQIEAVSYNDDGGRLNLVVKTKSGAAKVETNQIQINNNAASADLSFMFGDESVLGEKASIVNQGNWVLITPTQSQKLWAKATVFDPDAPFSEILTFLLPLLNLEMDPEVAKNLLIGLRVATQSFSVNVSPETLKPVLFVASHSSCLYPPVEATPIENVEKSGNLVPGTNQPNPTPTA